LRGSAVHKTLERFFREGYADSGDYAYYDDTRNAILSLFNDEWRSRKDQLLRLDLKEQDLAFYYADSQKMLINWLHDHLKSNETNGHPPMLEQTIFSKKWMLMGRIDAIYSARDPPLLIDWKTCKSIDFTDDYKRQMAIYALLYEGKYGQKPTTAIHYLKFLDGLRKFNISENFMEDLKNTILEVHHKTMSTDEEDYPCKCGGWCEKDLFQPNQTKAGIETNL